MKTNVMTPQVNGKESVTNPLGSGATTPMSLKRKDPLFIKQMFDEFDTDKDGKVAPKELQAALSRLHIPTSEKQMEEIWWICDQNGDGAIEYPEFANFVLAKERELRQVFDSIGE
jgi:Ca2+-binding EF-hand superfamily protein